MRWEVFIGGWDCARGHGDSAPGGFERRCSASCSGRSPACRGEEEDAGPAVSECVNEGEVRATGGEGFRARAWAGPLWAATEGERDGPQAGHCWLRPFIYIRTHKFV